MTQYRHPLPCGGQPGIPKSGEVPSWGFQARGWVPNPGVFIPGVGSQAQGFPSRGFLVRGRGVSQAGVGCPKPKGFPFIYKFISNIIYLRLDRVQ